MGGLGGAAAGAGVILLLRLVRAERQSEALWAGVVLAIWSLAYLTLGMGPIGSAVVAVWASLAAFFFGVAGLRMWRDSKREAARPNSDPGE